MYKISVKNIIAVFLALFMITAALPNCFVFADADDFSSIEFYSLEMRSDDSVTESDYLSGYAVAANPCVYKDYLLVPAFFSAPKNAENQNVIFIYDLSSGTPKLSAKYNMTDLGISERTGQHARKADIISGLYINDDYMFVTTDVKTGWPEYIDYVDTLYIYENPLKGSCAADTLTRVKSNDKTVTSGTISDKVTDSVNFALYNDGGVNMNSVGNYLITFNQAHPITEKSTLSVSDISGDTVSVNSINEYELLKYEGRYSYRFCDVVFDGNYAYVLTALEGANANNTADLAVFTVDFTNPLSPALADCLKIESSFKYSEIANLGAYMTLEDGFAYISTCGINNRGAGAHIDNCAHLITLKKSGSGFEFIKNFAINGNMTLSGGFGTVLAVEDIVVALNGPCMKNSVTYLKLNDTKDEILSYKKGSYINTDSSANSVNGIRYGSKLIFSLLRTGVFGATDTNKAVVDIFDVLNKGLVWDENTNVQNKTEESIYAEFEDPYINRGINTLFVNGTTSSDKDIQIIFSVYDENDRLITTEVKNVRKAKAGEKISFTESIDLSEINTDDCKLKALLWEGIDSVRPIAQAVYPTKASFTFTIEKETQTSAGVYDKNGKLVRTLWSAVSYEPGTYTKTWDGKDDQGVIMPDDEYKVSVLTSNVKFEKFVDVIGNNSDCYSWDTYISSYCSIFDMGYDPRSGRIYYCSNHVEGGYGLRYLNENNLHKNASLMQGFYPNMTATRVAVDSERIYWGSEEIEMGDYDKKGYKYSRSFIYATDDTAKPYKFEHGNHVTSKWNDANNCIMYPSALNIKITKQEEPNRISGLEVQQNGNLLFSSYLDSNAVYVNDKNTGELLYTLEVSEPGGIAIGGNSEDILYVAQKEEDGKYSISSYTIGTNGALSLRAKVTENLDSVVAVAVSPDNSKIAAAEAGSKNKITVFNCSTGTVIASYGNGESYLIDPTVKDDKLSFADNVWGYSSLYEHSFIEFLNNSEILFGDSGNSRFYKMNIEDTAMTLEDKVIFLGVNYNCYAVQNQEDRIFAECMEYSVDYDKLERYAKNKDIPFENTWKLEKNYRQYLGNRFPQIKLGAIEGIFADAVLLSNGYTYFSMKESDGNSYLYKEKNGNIERTDIDMTRCDMLSDGSIYYKEYKNGKCTYYKKVLTGFDNNDNPIWGEAEILSEMSASPHSPYNGDPNLYQVAITDSEKFVILNPVGPVFSGLDTPGKNMHLGAIDISRGQSNEYEWTASPRTLRRRQGEFPKDGYFDIGNGVTYTARHPLSVGNNILFHYRGEGYNGGQSNQFLHFLDNGLLVGVYGRSLQEYGGQYNLWSGSIVDTQPCNSFSISLVPLEGSTDVAYIFQNSEGAAGGVHVSRLSGLDSINVTDIPIKWRNSFDHGISYSVYNNTDLNSSGFVKNGTTNSFEIPEITENSGQSVRFKGYFVPKETKTYRFGVKTDGNVRVHIEDALVMQGSNSLAYSVYLEEGKRYAITLEAMPLNGKLSYLKVGYEEYGVYKYLNNAYMECDYPVYNDGNRINLLEGYFYGEAFAENLYGWHTEMFGGDSSAYINVLTNVWNYRHGDDTDMFIKFAMNRPNRNEKNETFLEKTLVDIDSDSWQIDMDIRMTGYLNRTYAKNVCGMIVEVLDKDDKVISDFYIGGGATNDEDFRAFINGDLIASYPKIVTGSSFFSVEQITAKMDIPFNLPQELKFTAQKDGTIRGDYLGETVFSSIVDSEADWQKPAKVRFKRFNNFGNAPYGSTMNITRFEAVKDTNK